MQLDGHRASCAICLLDFQEPKRVGVGALKTVEDKTDSEAQAQAQGESDAAENEAIDRREEEEVEEVGGDVTEQTTAPVSLNGDNLRLQDAGEGAQPLRLLKCGHVFHVSLLSFTWERYCAYLLTIFAAATENMRGPVAPRCIGSLSSVSTTCTRKRA